jgi:predicted ferric reductase
MASPVRRVVFAPAAPRRWPFTIAHARFLFAANAALIAVIWLRHFDFEAATTPAAILTGAGELTALLGTYLVLIGLLFAARAPFLDQLFGDRAAHHHKTIGCWAIALIAAHVVCSVAGYTLTDGLSVGEELLTIVLTYPYMLAGLAGFAMFLAVGASSIRFVRSRLSYETWTGLHMYAYLAVLLAFGHQLAVGADFANHPLSRLYWVGLYIFVFGVVIVFRIAAPLRLLARHRFRIAQVVHETSDVVSIYIEGRHLDRLRVQAGQYFRIRLLVRNEWWRSHPFSISAAPDGRSLRFTVKSLGDFSERLQSLEPGPRVMLEGPYGALTGDRRTRRRVALIGGGIGVTPIRALFEEFAGDVDVRLIYRASRVEDVAFSSELDEIARKRDARVTYLVGKRGSASMPADPLSASALSRLVPDILSRDVFVCGPTPMMDTVERSLRELGVPQRHVHTERFAA